MEIELTKPQLKYLDAIRWLLEGHTNFGSGRTFLMAVVFIEMALASPGRKVYVFDNGLPLNRCEFVLNTVKAILPKEILKKTKFGKNWFSISVKATFLDHLPKENYLSLVNPHLPKEYLAELKKMYE